MITIRQLTFNKSLQQTFDPEAIFGIAELTTASNATERRRYASKRDEMEYEIHVRDGIVEIVTHGDAEVSVFQNYLTEALALKEWMPGTPLLTDHSDLNVRPLTVGNVREIADILISFRHELGASRFAVVSGSDLVFGLARMWYVFVDGKWDGSANIFRNKEEALHWLKQP